MLIRRWLPVFILLMAAVPTASAHRPGWGDADGVTEIADIATSWAFYRDLDAGAQVDVYAFTAQAGDDLHAGINIPAVGGLEDYGVTMALIGPGLSAAGLAALPFDPPEGAGAVLVASVAGEDFFEPFTQTNYWGRQRIDLALMQGGEYYLAVWHPAGAAGKYVLDVGTAEVFGPADLFQFPLWWLRVHAFFGHTPWIAGAGLALLAGGALVIFGLRRPIALRGQYA